MCRAAGARPDFLLLYGVDDEVVDPRGQTLHFAEMLEQTGFGVSVVPVSGAPGAFLDVRTDGRARQPASAGTAGGGRIPTQTALCDRLNSGPRSGTQLRSGRLARHLGPPNEECGIWKPASRKSNCRMCRKDPVYASFSNHVFIFLSVITNRFGRNASAYFRRRYGNRHC